VRLKNSVLRPRGRLKVSRLEMVAERCDCLHCMATMTKDESVTLRLTKPEKAALEAAATLTGQAPGTLAALYVK